MKKAFLLSFLLIFTDQLIKIWVKTHMHLGEEIHVAGNWFIIHFTENKGMAFGMQLAGDWGKLLLTVFRLILAGGLAWYIYTLSKKRVKQGLLYCGGILLAGAVGNIIDSVFYGQLFSDSIGQIATLFPADGGYAPLLHGEVVDMFYFPIIEGHFPEWFPFWGSEEFIFFRPVFNFADACITISIALGLIFQKKFFKDSNFTPYTEDDAVA